MTATGPRTVDAPDNTGGFPRLDDNDLEQLLARGHVASAPAGTTLFSAGEHVVDFLVVMDGAVGIVDESGSEERLLRVHRAGSFIGDLGILEGQPTLYSARVLEDAELLSVPTPDLVHVLARNPVLGEMVLRALLIRRTMLIESGTGIRIVGSCYSPETRRLLEFAARNRLPHRLIDLDRDRDTEGFLQRLGVGVDETPLVIVGSHEILRNPSPSELADLLGLRRDVSDIDHVDLIVIGAGPAGLATSVYAASDGLDVLTLEALAAGGQAATSALIENYLGFPAGISGAELAERAVLQTKKFDAKLTVPTRATSLRRVGGTVQVGLDDGTEVVALAAVIATGVHYRRLDIAGIDRFEGTSVYYAATVHEAMACRADPVVVVGGGNSAGQAALFLAKSSSRVTLVARDKSLSENMSRYLISQIEQHPLVDVFLESQVRAVEGDDVLREVTIVRNDRSEETAVRARALFVFIGAQPHTDWLKGTVALDDNGYVLTGTDIYGSAVRGPHENGWPDHSTLQTSVPGVLAVGDVRAGSVKRVTAAMGEGAMAVGLIHGYLARSGTRPPSEPARQEQEMAHAY
jgi:thioredoxin reductase (NADPH)